MILARLTSDPLIKLLGKELVLLEELPNEEGTKYSLVDKLPPDLKEYCSYFYLEPDEFQVEKHLENDPATDCGFMSISQNISELHNYSENVWEILEVLGDQLGDEKNYEASKLQKIRVSTEQITEQAQRLLKASAIMHKKLERIIRENQLTQTAA